MGSSSSTAFQPTALQKGISVIDQALDQQYKEVERLGEQCTGLSSRKRETEQKLRKEIDELSAAEKQCYKSLQILTERDAKLRAFASQENRRLTKAYTTSDPIGDYAAYTKEKSRTSTRNRNQSQSEERNMEYEP